MNAKNVERATVAIESITPAGYNPRKITTAARSALKASLDRWGVVQEIVVNRRTGNIVGGHQRFDILREEGAKQVPVCWVDLADDEERALNVALNSSTLTGEFDDALLRAVLADIGPMDGLVDELDLGSLLEPLADKPKTEGQDETPDNVVTRVKAGDVWRLGKHRVACGDSTDAALVSRLTDGRVEALFWDPPWNIDFTPPSAQTTLAFTDGRRCCDVIGKLGAPTWVFVWDCVSSWYTPNRPLQRGKLALWYGSVDKYNPEGAHYGDAGDVRTVTNTRGSYEFTPDPRGKHLSDVFSSPITKLHSEVEHSHSKPIDWVRMLIGNCTTGDVFDPFLGSGASLIACEQISRRCVGVELDPAACDLAISRWEAFTGLTATLEK